MTAFELVEGDCRAVMAGMEPHSVDAIVTDPPAGIGFMGRTWDHDHGGREGWVTAFSAIFRECLRVIKPGGHAFVWAIPRTAHWTATALEDAGFDIRDVVTHLFGSGFPKSLNLGNGWGTALKPAAEFWILARAPLAERNIAANVTKYGTGGLNVDGCRVEGAVPQTTHDVSPSNPSDLGRWPPNVALDEDAAALLDAQTRETVSRIGKPRVGANGDGWGLTATGAEYADTGGASRFMYVAKADRAERDVGMDGGSLWGEAEAAVERVVGVWGGDEDDLSEGKRSTVPRRNDHPTVKPIALMRWLCRLVTPPGGLVLDPFAGSGTTGIAALAEGFRFVGIERDPHYCDIARRRIGAGAML